MCFYKMNVTLPKKYTNINIFVLFLRMFLLVITERNFDGNVFQTKMILSNIRINI